MSIYKLRLDTLERWFELRELPSDEREDKRHKKMKREYESVEGALEKAEACLKLKDDIASDGVGKSPWLQVSLRPNKSTLSSPALHIMLTINQPSERDEGNVKLLGGTRTICEISQGGRPR